MRLYLRNKVSGEIRDVEADTPEFYGMVKEVTSTGLPMWEQTSFPAADGIKERAAYGELDEEDLGSKHQDELRYAALNLDAQGVAPEANPHLQLTPGELEAGLTPKQKLADLQDMFDKNKLGRSGEIFANAADTIRGDDELKERPGRGPSRGQSARAGGSDDRENTPTVDASTQDEGDDESDAFATSGAGRSEEDEV